MRKAVTNLDLFYGQNRWVRQWWVNQFQFDFPLDRRCKTWNAFPLPSPSLPSSLHRGAHNFGPPGHDDVHGCGRGRGHWPSAEQMLDMVDLRFRALIGRVIHTWAHCTRRGHRLDLGSQRKFQQIMKIGWLGFHKINKRSKSTEGASLKIVGF